MPSNTFPEEVVDRQKFENGEAVDLGIREPNSLPENMSNLELNGKDLTLNSAISSIAWLPHAAISLVRPPMYS